MHILRQQHNLDGRRHRKSKHNYTHHALLHHADSMELTLDRNNVAGNTGDTLSCVDVADRQLTITAIRVFGVRTPTSYSFSRVSFVIA